MTSFCNLPIYCPVLPASPLPTLPGKNDIICMPVVPYEEALRPKERARLAILQKERFRLIANQDLCRKHSWQAEDIEFTPQDFARYLQAKGREAWIVGSQTRPTHIPKHDIDIRFYVSGRPFAHKAALQDKLAYLISRFIRWKMRQKSRECVRAIPDNISTRLAVYGVAIQVFALPEQPHTPSWALIQLGALQINALYCTRLHSISSSTGGQWSILRNVARWSIGHSFATDHAGFMTAKSYASKRICQISYPQFLHNLIYRLMLEASHGSRFLHSLDRSSPLLKTAVEKFFIEHARDFERGRPVIMTKNLLRYMKEHARTPHKRLADFLYLLLVLQHQPHACAFLAHAFLDIAKVHEADVQIAAFAKFAEFIQAHPTLTASFLAVLQGLCICCQWTTQESPAGNIKAYTALPTDDWRPYFIFKETYFTLPFDYYSPLNLATSLLTHWPKIFTIPASTTLLQGLFAFLELPAKYLTQDPELSLKHVTADLLVGFQQHYVREIIDQFHGKGSAKMWYESMLSSHTRPSTPLSIEAGKSTEADSKQKNLEKIHLLNLLGQTHKHLANSTKSLEVCRCITTMGKLAEPILDEKELLGHLDVLITLLEAIKASSEKTSLLNTLKQQIDDFFPHLEVNLLNPAPKIRALAVDFYFQIQDFLSHPHSLNFFTKILKACKKEDTLSKHRLIIHGLQNSFLSEPSIRLSAYCELLSSENLTVLKQAFQLVESALNDSAHDADNLKWFPTLMRKLLAAKCQREACELLLHMRRYDKLLFQRFLDAAETQVFGKQLVEAAQILSLLPKDPQATKIALRVLILMLKGTANKTFVEMCSELFSREISAHFLMKTKRPNLPIRYRLLRLADRLLDNKANLSPTTRSLCLEHLVLKCMETHKKHQCPTVTTSYRQMAIRTFKKFVHPLEDSRAIQDLHQIFLVRMASLIGSKHSTFIFLGKILLDHTILSKHPQRKPLKWLVDKQTIDARFFETFRNFALELHPALAAHRDFSNKNFDHTVTNTTEGKEEEKTEKHYVEPTIDTKIISSAWKTCRQRDSSEKLELTKNAILWLLDNMCVNGKETHARLLNHCQFIIQGLVDGQKRLCVLSEDEQFFIANNLLHVIELLAKSLRSNTVNAAFHLFSLVTGTPTPQAICFEQIQSTQKRGILAQRRLSIATTLLQNFLHRRAESISKDKPQKLTFEAMHFLTHFLLTLDLKSGMAYQLMVRAIAFLPRNPPHALEYPEAVSILSKLCTHAEGALRSHVLLQHCVLRTIKEGINGSSESHLFLALQLCGQLINHRLIVADCWQPVTHILSLLMQRLRASKIKPTDEDFYKWLVLPLIKTQALNACPILFRKNFLSDLSTVTTSSDVWLPQLLAPHLLMEYYWWRIVAYNIPTPSARAWLKTLLSLSNLDPALEKLHTQCHIGLCLQSNDSEAFKAIFKNYLTLEFAKKEALLAVMINALVRHLSAVEHFNPRTSASLFEPLVTSFLPFIHDLMEVNAAHSPYLEFIEEQIESLFKFFEAFKKSPAYETFLAHELSFIQKLSEMCTSGFMQTHIIPRYLDHYMSAPLSFKLKMLHVLEEIHHKFEHEYAKEESDAYSYTCSFAWNELFKKESLYAKSLLDSPKKNISIGDIELFGCRVVSLLLLGRAIPLHLVQTVNLLINFRNLIRNLSESESTYKLGLESLHVMLDIAIKKGPFTYLSESLPKTLSSEGAKHLAAAKMDLQLGLLHDLTITLNESLALYWHERLQNSYHTISSHEEYTDKYLNNTIILSYCLFAKDPLSCRAILRQYEQFFLKACDHLNTEFAIDCLSAIEMRGHIFSTIPLLVDLIVEAFRRNKIKPTPSILMNPQQIMLLIGGTKSLLQTKPYNHLNEQALPSLLPALKYMLINNGFDIEHLQKKIKNPSYMKRIKEISFEAYRMSYACLSKFKDLPDAPLWKTLLSMSIQVLNLHTFLRPYFPAKEMVALVKECQALVTPWDPLLNEVSKYRQLMTPKALEHKIGKTLAHILSEAPKAAKEPIKVTEERTTAPVESKEKSMNLRILSEIGTIQTSLEAALQGLMSEQKKLEVFEDSKNLVSPHKKKTGHKKKNKKK